MMTSEPGTLGLRGMLRRSGGEYGLLLLVALGSLAAPLRAEPRVELKLHGSVFYVNERFEFSIEVHDFEDAQPPRIPALDDCTIRSAGGTFDSQQVSIVNGRRQVTRTRAYRYEAIPHAVGPLTIPEIPVRVDRELLTTQPVTVQVEPSDAQALFSITIDSPRERIFVGQKVPVVMTLWIKPPRYGRQLLDAGQTMRLIDPVNFGPFPRQVRDIGRRDRPGDASDDPYYFYEFATEIVPEHPGRVRLDEIEVALQYPTGAARRQLVMRPTVLVPEVQPVPMEGRPENFGGAVGIYDIRTSARPTDVRVGDPIHLTIEIAGDGPLDSLPPPLLASHAQLVRDFNLPQTQLAGTTVNGRRRFELDIRAARDDVTEIPAIAYPYFDPDAERFVSAQSDPIPLTVSAAAEVVAPELSALNVTRDESDAGLDPLAGLRDIETRAERLLATRGLPTRAELLALAVVPAVLFACTWVGLTVYRARRGDPGRLRRLRALRNARRRLAAAREQRPRELAMQVGLALRGYLADRTDQPEARFAGSAAAEALGARGVPEELLACWLEITERCEQMSYAPGAEADGEALCDAALACLERTERVKL